MNPKFNEFLAAERIDALHREAANARLVARPEGRTGGRLAIWRRSLVRLAPAWRRIVLGMARRGGDLARPRGTTPREDVLGVRARRLRNDPD